MGMPGYGWAGSGGASPWGPSGQVISQGPPLPSQPAAGQLETLGQPQTQGISLGMGAGRGWAGTWVYGWA